MFVRTICFLLIRKLILSFTTLAVRPESYDGEKNQDSIEPPTKAPPEMDVTSIELPTVSNILPLGKFSSFLFSYF